MPPALVYYATESEYRSHYEAHYCRAKLYTFDGFRVYFPKRQFDDAFFESANRRARDKSVFSRARAERIDWIATALQDPTAQLYVGWNRDKKAHDFNRRVVLVYRNYVVILKINRRKHTSTFITAYVADASTLRKIKTNPRWT